MKKKIILALVGIIIVISVSLGSFALYIRNLENFYMDDNVPLNVAFKAHVGFVNSQQALALLFYMKSLNSINDKNKSEVYLKEALLWFEKSGKRYRTEKLISESKELISNKSIVEIYMNIVAERLDVPQELLIATLYYNHGTPESLKYAADILAKINKKTFDFNKIKDQTGLDTKQTLIWYQNQ